MPEVEIAVLRGLLNRASRLMLASLRPASFQMHAEAIRLPNFASRRGGGMQVIEKRMLMAIAELCSLAQLTEDEVRAAQSIPD